MHNDIHATESRLHGVYQLLAALTRGEIRRDKLIVVNIISRMPSHGHHPRAQLAEQRYGRRACALRAGRHQRSLALQRQKISHFTFSRKSIYLSDHYSKNAV